MHGKALLSGVSVVLLAVVVAGCASVNVQRQRYVAAHPELAIDVQNAIINGEIIAGMGPAEVRAALGNPANIVKHAEPGRPTTERWIYFKKMGKYVSAYEVRFVNGSARELTSDGYMNSRTSGRYSGAHVPWE
jgi:hypothetical protein